MPPSVLKCCIALDGGLDDIRVDRPSRLFPWQLNWSPRAEMFEDESGILLWDL